MRRVLAAWLAAAGLFGAAAPPEYQSAKQKLRMLQEQKLPPGGRVTLSGPELTAYARVEAPKVAPEGVRDPRIRLGNGRATATAQIDFPRLRRSQGEPMGWFLSNLLAGERPVEIQGRIVSGGGTATVLLDRVSVSGVALSGGALDFVIKHYLHSYYPDAKVGRPFELADGVDRLEIQPAGVSIIMAQPPQRWRRAETAGNRR
jgi:hypothetical protein